MKIWILPLALMTCASSVSVAVAAPRPAQQSTYAPRLINLSRQVANRLKQNNTRSVSLYVDRQWGLRFSPEVFASQDDLKFNRPQVAALRSDKKVRTWGTYDGEGGPIKLNWEGYHKRFVWPRDFTKGAEVAVNRFGGGRSNTLNNLRELYPSAAFVEFYLPPSSRNKMDWASLWMVWKQKGTTWRLIGIAHDQWSV